MVISFKFLNAALIEHIIIATSNPFISLFIGLLITAMMQSSSTTTTMIVAIVASGTITLDNAIFMVMGANIGTTVTSTLVSLGHVTRKKEFRKAIAAATLHDFFNIFTAIILLPLEYYFGILSGIASFISSYISMDLNTASYLWENIQELLGPSYAHLYTFIRKFDLFSLLLSVLILFVSLHFISGTFRQILLDQEANKIENYAFKSPFRSLLISAAVTGAVQSSSLVTSLIVPIVANNRLSLRNSFPFIMGANIGTTLTALIAALSESEAALSIAIAHLLFNIIGVLIFFPFAKLHQLPVNLARGLGKATLKNRMVGFVYVVLTFFIIPFFLIFFSRGSVHIKQYSYLNVQDTPTEQVAEFGFKSSTPVKLIYKQTNISNDFEFSGQTESGAELYGSIQEDTVIINQNKFVLKDIGHCWQSTDWIGAYTICIKDIVQNFKLHPHLKVDSCYIFTKRYHINQHNQYIHRLYLDPKSKLIIKHEVLDQEGVILGKEELMSIVRP